MATQSSILAWEIPWTEEPGGLQPMRHVQESDMIERLTSSLHLYNDGITDFLNMSRSPALDQPLSPVSGM